LLTVVDRRHLVGQQCRGSLQKLAFRANETHWYKWQVSIGDSGKT